ncbi:metallophosphoesterase domain-containing protein 1 isoform X2 [Cimex lectularius]|uniref:Calcineurin-like phosphoesterase domain-containing protein n=1 Tax=Cimex lectularius TaxID=79782 RepID=A0A8I6SBB3_CIMLE|nr:metallophosphoesterase domain-containing protein 1 isoform X2 [Cimex lectularius]
MKIDIHPLTDDPNKAWKELSLTQKVIKINVPPVPKKPSGNKLRIVCMSDTHSLTSHIRFKIPDGDIFIHAGDFTRCGAEGEVLDFNKWIGKLPHKYKVVIAGNHELSFDQTFTHPLSPNPSKSIPTLGIPMASISDAISTTNMKDKLTNCLYLQDESVVIAGLKIYGSPWQPEFHGWAFNVPRGRKCLEKWDLIPDDTDILVTHTPPIGHGDLCCSGVRAGCVELLSTVQRRVKPKYHVFGHIHEGYGITTDGSVIYVNASTCNIQYNPVNPPIVFDVAIPEGARY